jgi:hypothetical protein
VEVFLKDLEITSLTRSDYKIISELVAYYQMCSKNDELVQLAPIDCSLGSFVPLSVGSDTQMYWWKTPKTFRVHRQNTSIRYTAEYAVPDI